MPKPRLNESEESVNLSVMIPRSWMVEIEEVAVRRKTSKSALVRKMLRRVLDAEKAS